MAASRPRKLWGRLFSGKGGQKSQATSTGTPSITPSVSSNIQATEDPSSGDSNFANPSAKTLWDRAYEALEKQSSDLTGKYQNLLIREARSLGLTSDGPQIAPPDRAAPDRAIQFDRSQLLEISEKGLTRIEENKTVLNIGNRKFVPKEQVASATELVLKIKDLISEAFKASPEASIAWGGVCLVLPLLTNPVTADEANRDGFTYVTMRMRYYTELESLVRPLEQSTNATDALMQVYNSIVDLYKSILEFQFLSVLRFFKAPFRRYAGDILAIEDWKKKRQDIERLEAVVNGDLCQIKEFVSWKELESLKTTTTASFEALQGLLSLSAKQLRVAEHHLDVAEDHRDISREQLLLLQDESERHRSDEEEKCLQLFRLTSNNKEATYEWYKDRVENRVEGTCQWFLKHDHFTEWMAQDSGMLLISADPGCGKSVLAKHLIDHVMQPANVCYFFFKDQDQNTVRQALCALLHQLLSQNTSLIKDHALPEYRKNGPGLVNTTASLWKIFDNLVQDPRSGAVIVVLDALDECAETEFEDLVRHIEPRFLGERPQGHKLKFLMTSRPYNQIVFEFRDLFNAIPRIHIPGEEHSEAISQEVNHVIEHRVKSLGLSSDLADHLTRRLLEIPHRTYLWVHLVFDNLKKGDFKKTPKGFDKMITKLPKNVNEAYEQILEKSKNQDGAKMALAIILAAQRPLTLSEMNIAMNIQEDHRAFSDLDLEDDEDFKSTLRSWCGLFVSIHHDKVYFLHQTAREFLLADVPSLAGPQSTLKWHHSISVHQSHTVLAEKCILYLSLYNYMESYHGASNDTFLEYAAQHWGLHYRKSEDVENSLIVPIAHDISKPVSISYSKWFRIFWDTTHRKDTVFSSLGISSYLGHKKTVERILATDEVDLNLGDTEYGQTPLSWAAENSHEAVVRLLLAADKVDIDSKDTKYGQTPLSWAAENGHEAVIKLLLATDKVDINSKNNKGQTPLILAAQEGHEAVVRLLLATKKVDIDSKDIHGQTPLSWAAENGHEAVVRLLLATEEVDINSKDKHDQTPLSWAAENGHEAVMRLLLAADKVDIDSKDTKYGQTPLSWAAENGHEAVIKLLLATDKVDINSKNNKGQTPLILAAREGYKAVVKLLLATKKVDINSKDIHDQTPLSWAAENGHEAVVRLLLAKEKVDIDSKDEDGRTPLSWAAEKGHEAVVRLLLATDKVDIDSKDEDGRTPLFLAAWKGYEAVVRLLLATDKIDIDSKDKNGQTPLSWAAENGHEAVILVLQTFQAPKTLVTKEVNHFDE